MSKPKLTPDQATAIRKAYWLPRLRDGWEPGMSPVMDGNGGAYPTLKRLAAEYHVGTCTIHRALYWQSYTNRTPRTPRRRRPPLTPEERRWAEERWRAGDTLAQIAVTLGISRTGVWHHVKGIPAPAKKWSRRSVERLRDALTAATNAA